MGLFNMPAQTPGMMFPMQRFQESQGYPAPIKMITQDQLGFLWMGTTDGVYRFDGHAFRAFRSRLNDEKSIPNNIINDIKVDASNRIWVATNGGLAYFDYANDFFLRIPVPDTLEKVDRYRVHAISFNQDGQLWFITARGLHQLDAGFHIQQSLYPELEGHELLRAIHFVDQNSLLLGTNNSRMIKLDVCSNNVHTIWVHSKYSRLMQSSTTISYFSQINETQLAVGSWMGGLNSITQDVCQQSFQHYENSFDTDIKTNIVTCVVEAQPDCWWVGTFGSGIQLFNPKKGVFYQKITYDPLNPYSLNSDYVLSLYKDHSGIIWIGTQEGLNKYDPNSHQFHTAMIPPFDMEKSVYRRPYCMLENRFDPQNNSILIAVPGVGLLTFNPLSGQFGKFTNQKFTSQFETNDWIYSMLYDKDQSLIALTANGLWKYDPVGHRFSALNLPAKMKFTNAHKFIQDRNGNFWIISSGDGVYFLSEDFNSFRHFSVDPARDSTGIQDQILFCILEDHSGKIWLGSQNNGIAIYDPATKAFKYVRHDRSNPRALPDNGVFDIEEDAESQIWVGTENGLVRFDKDGQNMKVFTDAEGLPNSNIASLILDAHSKVWLATNNGLAVLNRNDGTFHAFSQLDGLASNRMRSASYMSPNGTIYFSTTSAISWCNSERLFVNKEAPPVYITGIKIYNAVQPVTRLKGQPQHISISYTRNLLEVEFAALSYSSSEKNKYAYFLEGYDKAWNFCSGPGSATYANLPGGDYLLKFKASNNDGVWNMSTDALHITVTPPFWQQSRFYLLSILLMVGSIYLYFRNRISQMKRIQQLRMAIARDLHDEVGSTLSSIFLTSNLHTFQSRDWDKMNSAMDRIQTAAKSAMETMNEIVWSLKPENDQLGPLVHRMRAIASEMLEPVSISLEFAVHIPVGELKIPLDKRKELILYFKEALNNMAKYSKASKAYVEIRLEGKHLRLFIKDNGCGFDIDSVKKGNGLGHLAERAFRMRGDHQMYSKPGSGTELHLEVKIIP